MPLKPESKCNPVQYDYKGFPIRKYNVVFLRVDETTYKEIIDTQLATGFSIKQIIAHSGKPCERCIGTNVKVLTDNGEVLIKRGILSKRIPSGYENSRDKRRKIINTETGQICVSAKEAARQSEMKYTTFLDKLNNRIPNNTKFKYYEPVN